MVSTASTETSAGNHVPVPAGGGPTALRIMLGAQLRRLREERRLSLEEAGEVIRASYSKISRLETGRVGFKDRDLTDLLTFYGITDEHEREAVRALARRANAPAWWHDYADVLPAWFEGYVGLEEAASQLRTCEVLFVPDLLQTREYARTLIRSAHPAAPSWENERRVNLRMARQAVLERRSPPHLWVVLDEAVLQRAVGGQDIMRQQFLHLIELAQRPRVTVQVIPFRAGGRAVAGGTLHMLRFAEPALPDTVYLEQLTSAVYLDKPEVVDKYLLVMELVCALAATPADSISMVRQALAELPR